MTVAGRAVSLVPWRASWRDSRSLLYGSGLGRNLMSGQSRCLAKLAVAGFKLGGDRKMAGGNSRSCKFGLRPVGQN